MPIDLCPDRKSLRAFGLGRLSAAELERVAAHVETCQSCQTTLKDLDAANDSVLAGLQLVKIGRAHV